MSSPTTPLAALNTAFDHLRAQGLRRSFPAGAELMRQGERGDSLFIIERGMVRAWRSHPALSAPLALAELGPGETVGEMAALDGGPRSATVVAVEDTDVLEVRAQALQEVMAQHQAVAQMLLSLVTQRLRSTDELAGQIYAEQERD